MKSKEEILIAALERIENPLKYLQLDAEKQRHQLNGMMAVQYANDANSLKQIASNALREAADAATSSTPKSEHTCRQDYTLHNLDILHYSACTKCGETNIIQSKPSPKSEQEIEEQWLSIRKAFIAWDNEGKSNASQNDILAFFKERFKAAHLSPDSDKWIKIESGEIPANDALVIVYCPLSPDFGLRTLAYSVDGDWYNGTRLLKNQPSHWQPLPPAPKQ